MEYVYTPVHDVFTKPLNSLSPLSPLSPLGTLSSLSPLNPLNPLNTLNSLNTLNTLSPLSPLVLTTDTPLFVNTPTVPLVLNAPNLVDPYGRSYVTSVNLNYTKPLISTYTDLNSDPRVQKRMIKYFQMKTLDKWLMEDLLDILNYFRIDGKGNVDIINNMNEYKPNGVQHESVGQLEKRIDFIEKWFLTPSVVDRILQRFASEKGIQWVHLTRYQHELKNIIADKLMKLVKGAITNKK